MNTIQEDLTQTLICGYYDQKHKSRTALHKSHASQRIHTLQYTTQSIMGHTDNVHTTKARISQYYYLNKHHSTSHECARLDRVIDENYMINIICDCTINRTSCININMFSGHMMNCDMI